MLQNTIVSVLVQQKGQKKLTIPKTSTSFIWNAPEVVSLCSQGCLYIRARIKPCNSEDSDEELVVVEVRPAVWFRSGWEI